MQPDLSAFYFQQFVFLVQFFHVLFFLHVPASYHSKCSFNSHKSLMSLLWHHSPTFPTCFESTFMSAHFSLRTSNSASSVSHFSLISKLRDAKAYIFFKWKLYHQKCPRRTILLLLPYAQNPFSWQVKHVIWVVYTAHVMCSLTSRTVLEL